ncbi:hypothetical protein M2650_00005, partial [Luteimonas sp. SX5]
AGKVKDRRSYGVWGDERDPNNWLAFKAAPKDELKLPNSGYTGTHERRQRGATAPGISGLIDMQARYYDPAAMQFLQPDSVVPDPSNPLSWNRRTYVNNSPVAFSDPTGHAPAKDPGFAESGEENVERLAAELDEATTSGGTYLANGGGLGTGVVAGDLMRGMRAHKPGGAQNAMRGKTLSQKSVSEMTAEEKFYVQAYQRDKANYERAGMSAPFANVEEYMLWRAMSREAQAMGVNSQMMDEMATSAEIAADAVGFGAANPMPNGIRASGVRSWISRLLGNVPPEVTAAARLVAQRREELARDLVHATKQRQLWVGISDDRTTRALRLYGEEIGKVVDFGGLRQIILLDAKFATSANAKAAWDVILRDIGGKKPRTKLVFEFGSDLQGAEKFRRELGRDIQLFVPADNLRIDTGNITWGIERYLPESRRHGGTDTYNVYIEIDK